MKPGAYETFGAQLANESWLTQNGGSLLIAVAAICAALLAAYVSIRNHRQQLDHDREMRDRDNTREAVDSAAADLQACFDLLRSVAARCRLVESRRSEIAELAGNPQATNDEKADAHRRYTLRADEAVEALERSVQTQNSVRTGNLRLSLRLGSDHSITTAHAAAEEALREWRVHLIPLLTTDRTEEERQAGKDLAAAASDAIEAFRDSCFAWYHH